MNADDIGEVTRGLVAVIVVVGYIGLAAFGKPIPEGLPAIVAGVVGFFFGSGGPAAALRALRAR